MFSTLTPQSSISQLGGQLMTRLVPLDQAGLSIFKEEMLFSLEETSLELENELCTMYLDLVDSFRYVSVDISSGEADC